ncbi:MAG TPA: HEAT repeat domain-containing protein, partial [Planctomycetota bacterium]|nr:HEAT repeat domain-containing protein [Planctomycetota bacterium]
ADYSAGAAGALIAASGDAEPQVAVEAVKFLSKRVDERVAAQLVALLESPEFTVRAWAARGLGEAGWRPSLPALESRLAREDQAAAERQIRQAIERLQPRAEGGAN